MKKPTSQLVYSSTETPHSSRFGCSMTVFFVALLGLLASYPVYAPSVLLAAVAYYCFPTVQRQRRLNADKRQAIQLHDMEFYEDAIPLLEEYLKAYPNDHWARVVLADSYYHQEKYQRVPALLQGIPASFPRFTKVLALLGAAYHQMGNTELAIETYERVAAIKKQSHEDLLEVFYNLGILYKAAGKDDMSEKAFKRVVSYDPHYRDIEKKLGKRRK